MIDYKVKSDLCTQLQQQLDELKQAPAHPAEFDDLHDIPQDYRDQWNLMSIKATNSLAAN